MGNSPSSPHHFRVLAIDPGTKIAGVSLLSFSHNGYGDGEPILMAHTAIEYPDAQKRVIACCKTTQHRNALVQRIQRIAFVRRELARIVADLSLSFDYVAYEQPFGNTEAAMSLHHATGALLTLSCFAGIPIQRVHTSSVKAVFGNSDLAFAPNVDRAAQSAKREKLKANVVLWANRRFSLDLTNSENDVADAIAVACAARKIICEGFDAAEAKAANKPLFGPGSRGPRLSKAREVVTNA